MSILSRLNVTFVGCGRMGSAIAEGAVRAGALDASRVYCVDAQPARAAALAQRIGAQVGTPSRGRTAWIIAVKPQDVGKALAANEIASVDVVISVAAGIRIESIRAHLQTEPSVVRAMPNMPALIGQGITAVLASNDDDRVVAGELFGAVGEVVQLKEEKHFDAVTAVSGSGPAYVFVAIEALADGGVAMGLPRDTALQLATQTVLGAAALAKAESAHVAELKDRVASPGGTTIAGLAVLEKAGFRSALIDAVRAATERGHELGGS